MTLTAKLSTQYEADWYAWAMENAELLRQRRLSKIDALLDESPSLRSKLLELVAKRYPAARKRAMRETGLSLTSFPSRCSYDVDELLDEEFWPE